MDIEERVAVNMCGFGGTRRVIYYGEERLINSEGRMRSQER